MKPGDYPYVRFEQFRDGSWNRVDETPNNESQAFGHKLGTFEEVDNSAGHKQLKMGQSFDYSKLGHTSTVDLNHHNKIGGSTVSQVTADHHNEQGGDKWQAAGGDTTQVTKGTHYTHGTGGHVHSTAGSVTSDVNDGDQHHNVMGDKVTFIGGVKYENVNSEFGQYTGGNYDVLGQKKLQLTSVDVMTFNSNANINDNAPQIQHNATANHNISTPNAYANVTIYYMNNNSGNTMLVVGNSQTNTQINSTMIITPAIMIGDPVQFVNTSVLNIGNLGVMVNGSLGSAGQALVSNGNGAFWTSTPISAAGTNTNVQLNLGNNFYATNGFNFDYTTNIATIGNTLNVPTLNVNFIAANGSTGNASQLLASGGGSNVYWVNTTSIISTSTANNSLYLGGVIAAGYQTTAGLSANVATLTSNNATNLGGHPATYYANTNNPIFSGGISVGGATTGMYIYDAGSNSIGIRTGPSTAYRYSTFDQNGNINSLNGNVSGFCFVGTGGVAIGANVILNTSTLSIGNSTVNTITNSTIFSGSSNNTLFVGSVSAANVVSNSQLSSNLANYQTTIGLAANVATLTSNNSTNLNGQPSTFYANNLFTPNNALYSNTITNRFNGILNLKTDFGATGDGVTDDSQAVYNWINKAITTQGANNAIKQVLYAPSGIYYMGSANTLTPLIHGPSLNIKGDGAEHTYFLLSNSYNTGGTSNTGGLFRFAECWYGIPGTNTLNANNEYAGGRLEGFTITGNNLSTSIQHGLQFLDRNDNFNIYDINLSYLSGSGLRVGGDLSGVFSEPQSYMRESRFNNIRVASCGNTTYPSVVISSVTASGSDATNEIKFTNLDVFGSGGTGVLISNPNAFNATRLIQFHALRIEQSALNNFQIGLSTDLGTIASVHAYGHENISPPSGHYGVEINSGATIPPYDVYISAAAIGPGAGSGVNIASIQGQVTLDIGNISASGNSYTVGPASGKIYGYVHLGPACEPDKWSTNIDATSQFVTRYKPDVAFTSNTTIFGANGSMLVSNGSVATWTTSIPGNISFYSGTTTFNTSNATFFSNNFFYGTNTVFSSNVFFNGNLLIGNSTVNTSVNSTIFTGTANNATYVGGIVASSVPHIIGQQGIPLIYPSSGTMGNNGALTMTTALDRTYVAAYYYMPASAISTGRAAGWYYGVGSSATAVTLYNNVYTSGTPNIPGTPTAFVTTGPGAYTQTTSTNIQGYTLAVPGNSIGPNGSVDVEMIFSYPSTAGTKAINPFYGTYRFGGPSGTTSMSYFAIGGFSNQGNTSVQVARSVGAMVSGVAATNLPLTGAIDSTTSQNIYYYFSLTSASDFIVLQRSSVMIRPSVT